MRRKIILYLAILATILAIGGGFGALYMTNTTSELRRLVKLHQVESLRRALVVRIHSVQSDLYTVHTPLERRLDSIVDNVFHLEDAIQNCHGCHHPPDLSRQFDVLGEMLDDYRARLSYYITASANAERIDRLKQQAALAGNELLMFAEEIAGAAGARLNERTVRTLETVGRTKVVLALTLTVSLLAAAWSARRLIHAVTRPVRELLHATGKIAGGALGFTLPPGDKTEFGALARNFNAMSLALKTGYDALQDEVEERKRKEDALRESNERYALAALGANDGLWDWNLHTNQVYLSARWKSMVGLEKTELGGSPEEWLSRLHPDDRPRVEHGIRSHLKEGARHLECEYRIRHHNGSYRWMLCRGIAVRDDTGRPYRMSGSQTDITRRKLAEYQLKHEALHDALTGLPNRTLFLERLGRAIEQAEKEPSFRFAIFFLDLDRFKVINDSLGHVVGDKLLVAVSRRLRDCLRPDDTVTRFGGDEFTVLVSGITDAEGVHLVANRIHDGFASAFQVDDQEIFVSVSIGIVTNELVYDKAEDLIRYADIAMYQAKLKGRSRHVVFESQMHAKTVLRMHLERDLRRALDRDELRLHYQPIVSLSANGISAFEALVRWQHPERGLIQPDSFIAIAEETGLIAPIGQWILNTACRQASVWQTQFPDGPPIAMSINISAGQFSPHLVTQVRNILDETRLDPRTVRLEITETMIMHSAEKAARLLEELKEMDLRLYIDDFGTGYSSLSYLHNFPIDALKIDRSFIHASGIDHTGEEVVKTIVALANNLDVGLVAEGVETREQLQRLRDLKCDQIQGFLFSGPLESAAAERILRRNAIKLVAAG